MFASWGQCVSMFDLVQQQCHLRSNTCAHILSYIFWSQDSCIYASLQHGTILPLKVSVIELTLHGCPQWHWTTVLTDSCQTLQEIHAGLKDLLGVSTPLYWDKLECLQCIIKIDMHPNKSIHTYQCHRTVLFRCLVFSFQLNFLMCICIIIILVCSLDPEIKDALRAIMKENSTLLPRAGRQT